MTDELVPVVEAEDAYPAEALNPVTGELVPLDDLARVARALDEIKVANNQFKAMQQAFTEAIIRASTAQGARTLTGGGFKIEVSPDTELEWDTDELEKLRDLGLPEARYNDLVKTEVTYKVNANVARQVAAANPEYAEVIERAKSRVPKRQYVTVKPTRVLP